MEKDKGKKNTPTNATDDSSERDDTLRERKSISEEIREQNKALKKLLDELNKERGQEKTDD